MWVSESSENSGPPWSLTCPSVGEEQAWGTLSSFPASGGLWMLGPGSTHCRLMAFLGFSQHTVCPCPPLCQSLPSTRHHVSPHGGGGGPASLGLGWWAALWGWGPI